MTPRDYSAFLDGDEPAEKLFNFRTRKPDEIAAFLDSDEDAASFFSEPEETQPDPMTFTESVGRGVDLAQGLTYGAVETAGELFGSEGLTEFGREGRERNLGPEMQVYGERTKFDDIDSFGDFAQWAKETAGEQIPMMAPSMLGNTIGGTLGALTGPAAPAMVPLGMTLGAYIPNIILGTGETQAAIKERDPEASEPGWALAGGSAIAALDSIVPGKLGGRIAKTFGLNLGEEVAKRILEKPVKENWIKAGAKEGAKSMAIEGITEATQEAISEVAAAHATDTDIDFEGLMSQMREAGAAGALMGGGAGFATEAATTPARNRRAAENAEWQRRVDEKAANDKAAELARLDAQLDARLAEMDSEASGASAPPPRDPPAPPMVVTPDGDVLPAELMDANRAAYERARAARAAAQRPAPQSMFQGPSEEELARMEGEGGPAMAARPAQRPGETLYGTPGGEVMTGSQMAATPPGAAARAQQQAQERRTAPLPEPIASAIAANQGKTLSFNQFQRALGIKARPEARALIGELSARGDISVAQDGTITIPPAATSENAPTGPSSRPVGGGVAAQAEGVPPTPRPNQSPEADQRAAQIVQALRAQGWDDREIVSYAESLTSGRQMAAPDARADAQAILNIVGRPAQRPTPAPVAAAGTAQEQTIPETMRTLLEQQRALIERRSPVMMFPTGTQELPVPPDMKRVQTERGVFHFNPSMINAPTIRRASAEGRENEILGLGSLSKQDVAASGEQAVAVVERTPDGAEVKAAVTTPSAVDDAAAAVTRGAAPNNTVSVEDPEEVVFERETQRLIEESKRNMGEFLQQIGMTLDQVRALPKDENDKVKAAYRTFIEGKRAKGDGTKAAPANVETAADLERAREKIAEPTEGQKDAGNYQKAHITWYGLPISIETGKGQARTGTDADGKAWSVTMPADYGYVKRTEGKDGDQVDVYMGDRPGSRRVFIVDQRNLATGKFDEHKVMLGYSTADAAMADYVAGFSDGRGQERAGAVTEMTVADFKKWLRTGNTKKAVGKFRSTAQMEAAKKLGNAPAEAEGGTDAITFLAARGGIRDDEGHDLKKGRGLQKMTRRGPLIRKTGMSIDAAGEALWDAGYFGPTETTPRPTENMTLEFIEKAHKTKTYLPEMQYQKEEDVAGEQDRARAMDALAAVKAEVEAAGYEGAFPQADLEAAAEIMLRTGLDAAEVLDQLVIEQERTAEGDAFVEPVEDDFDGQDPFELGEDESRQARGAPGDGRQDEEVARDEAQSPPAREEPEGRGLPEEEAGAETGGVEPRLDAEGRSDLSESEIIQKYETYIRQRREKRAKEFDDRESEAAAAEYRRGFDARLSGEKIPGERGLGLGMRAWQNPNIAGWMDAESLIDTLILDDDGIAPAAGNPQLEKLGNILGQVADLAKEIAQPQARSDSSLNRTASWVIKNKETGDVVMETFDRSKVDALNTDKYEAVPIQEHLASLNAPKDDRAPKTEKIDTVEGKRDQFVMPGAERSAKQAAKARGERIKPKAPQKDADEGLFDTGKRDQGEMFSAVGGLQYPMADRGEWYSDADYEQTGGRLVYMTPDEFLARVRPLKVDETSRENIDELKGRMRDGLPVDPLKLYKNGTEDGRHRAHAARELGIESIPVISWQKGRASNDDGRDLIIQHNITAQNLMHASRMGGIAVPSLAITPVDSPITGFGEITLIGPREMADPRGYARTQVFGADIYSPRYPEVSYRLRGAPLARLTTLLKPYMRDGEKLYGESITSVRDLESHDAFQAYAKDQIGEDWKYADRRALAEKTLIDVGAEERLFQGFTYSGNRRYKPHTLENVVRILKKELRGGEGFNYGVGSLRARFTPRFRSLSQIKKNRKRLVDPKEFEAIKKEVDAEFFSIVGSLEPYSEWGKTFGFPDTIISVMEDAGKMGIPRALKEYGIEYVPTDIQAEMRDFLTKLRELPTEYFEAKIMRPVDLSEFKIAVTPNDLDARVRTMLENRGVKVETYKRGDEADRKAVTKRAAEEAADDVMFSAASDAAPFFSALTRAVENMNQPKAPASQWMAMIRKAPGVKTEEIEWSGVEQWLASLGDGSIARDRVVEFLRANEIKVEDVIYGAPRDRKYDGMIERAASILESVGINPDEAFDLVDEMASGEGNVPAEARSIIFNQLAEIYPDEPSYGDAEMREVNKIASEAREYRRERVLRDPKYKEHTLPGGDNYGELLLTLPKNPDRDNLAPSDKAAEKYKKEWDALVVKSTEAQRRINKAYETNDWDGADAAIEDQRKVNWEMDRVHQKMVDEEIRLRGGLKENFTQSHFKEPNVVAHVRFNERDDADGKRVLFIEEIQSDWHQKGRKEGYAKKRKYFSVVNKISGNTSENMATRAEAEKYISLLPKKLQEGVEIVEVDDTVPGVPDAPFKTTWQELAFKRALRWAVENGFDRVAWTTGAQQAERYDLSKQIDDIIYRKDGDDDYYIGARKDGKRVLSENMGAKKLEETVGKDVADKIVKGDGENYDVGGAPGKRLSGLDLKVGGEGMVGFYDQILPRFVNRYVKKWGAKVGQTKFALYETLPELSRLTGEDITIDNVRGQGDEVVRNGEGWSIARPDGSVYGFWERRQDADTWLRDTPVGQGQKLVGANSVDITPAMRDSIMQGQPLFRAETGQFKPGVNRAEIERNVRDIVAEVSGGKANVTFEDVMFGQGSALTQSGARSTRKQQVSGSYNSLARLIRVSMSGIGDPIKTGLHEVFHDLQKWGAFTPDERRALDTSVTRMKEIARTEGLNPEGMSQNELEAVAFAFVERKRMNEESVAGLSPALRRAFAKVRDILDRIKRFLSGKGWKTIDDVFASARSGEIAARGAGDLIDRPRRGRNRTYSAQDVTKTPAFKRWFGDSKVVDEDGKPLVIYHGTAARDDFESFKRRPGDVGIHFGTAGQAQDRTEYLRGRRHAESGGGERMIPVYLSIKNPVRLDDAGRWTWENMEGDIVRRGIATSEEMRGIRNSSQMRAFLQSKGFDGIVYKNTGEVKGSAPLFNEAIRLQKIAFGGKGYATVEDRKTPEYKAYKEAWDRYIDYREKNAEDSYIAFERSQIKSVFNRGTFDPKDPRISYSVARRGDRPAFADFSARKVVQFADTDRNGAFFARIPAQQFIDLTTTPDGRSDIMSEPFKTSNIQPYDEVKSEFDPQDFDLEYQFAVPFLRVNDSGRIVSHEGRHRAAALLRDGATTIPIAITPTSDAKWKDSGRLPDVILPQDFGRGGRGTGTLRLGNNFAYVPRFADDDQIAAAMRIVGPESNPDFGEEQYSVTTLDAEATPEYPAETKDIRSKGVQDISKRIRQGNDAEPVMQRVRRAIREFKEEGARRLLQGVADTFYAVDQLERSQNAGQLLDASKSAYKATRMTQNITSVMSYVLRHGPIQIKDGGFVPVADHKFKGGFQGIFTNVLKAGEMELFKDWIIAQRASRLIGEGRENLLTADEIAAIKGEVSRNKEREARFMEAFKNYQDFNATLLDMAVATGRVSAKQADLWRKNGDYVPFYRLMEGDDIADGPKKTRGLSQSGKLSERLKGGRQRLGDPIENMVMNMTAMVDKSMKNEALRRVVDMAIDAGMMAKADEAENVLYTDKQISEMLERNGIKLESLPAAEQEKWIKMLTAMVHPPGNAVTLWRDGNPERYHVYDPLLLKAVSSMTPVQLGALMKLMRGAKRVLTEGVTMSPAFMAANLMRDTLSSWAISGQKGLNPFIGAPRGLVKAWKEDPSILAIQAAGGGTAGFYGIQPEDIRKQIDDKLKGVDRNRVVNTVKKAWELWHRIGTTTEQANRIAIYDQVKKNGGTDAEAAYQALDIMDFSLRGDYAAVRMLVEMIPFLNARIQGLYRLYRGAVKGSPTSPQGLQKQFIFAGSIIMGATLALAFANADNDEYDALEDWDKDTYWHFWIDGEHWRIPKPFEVGAIFATMPERAYRLLRGQDTGGDFADAVARMFVDTFAVDVRPQLLKPMIEGWANRNSFSDRDIIPASMQDLLPEAQYSARTTETARILGRAIPDSIGDLTEKTVGFNIKSPLIIDHLIRGYVGEMGMYVAESSDFLARAVGDYAPKPSTRASDLPVVSRFYRGDDPRTERFLQDFYDRRREVEQVIQTVRRYQLQGDVARARELLEDPDNREKLKLRAGLQTAYGAIVDITALMRQVQDSRNLSPERKREMLDRLTRQRNRVARLAVNAAPATANLLGRVSGNTAAERKLQSEGMAQ